MTRRGPVALLLALMLVATDAAAQVYRWVDEQGGVHYSGSREQVPERYRSQLPPDRPAEPAIPERRSAPDASRRPGGHAPSECILVVPGSFLRPRDSRSFPSCDACQRAIAVLSADEATRASCIPVGQ